MFVLLIIFLLLFCLSLILGGESFLSLKLEDILQGKDTISSSIFWDIRLPRSSLAALSGASLALSGALSQGIFRNPLAGPSVIGTNAGGVLGAIFMFYFGFAWQSIYAIPVASIVGSALSTFLVISVYNRLKLKSIGSLLLLGFAFNAFVSGMTSFTLSFLLNDFEKATSALRWMLGSYSSASWKEVYLIAGTTVVGVLVATKLGKKIDILSMGDDVAKSLAVDPDKLKNIVVICIAILVGGSISVAGGVPFIGLVVPHFTRLVVGPSHPQLFKASLINGASLAILCDLVARNISYPAEIEIGSITTILGAPFFIFLLIKTHKRSEHLP